MDVLQLFDNELRNKSNWSLEDKARYLYIRSCKMFSYDARYKIFRNIYSSDKVEKEIVLKEIDLRNVTDFKVVCTSYSRYVFKVLLEELLNIHVSVCGDSHKYNLFKIDSSRYLADVTNQYDLERVKMGLKTESYYDLDIGRGLNNKRLEKIDKKIEYIESEYFEETLKRRINNLEFEYYNVTGKSDDYDEVSYFLFQMQIIKQLFDEINIFKQYSEAFYCQKYLLSEFFKDCSYNFHNNSLFDIMSDGTWKFINILDIDFRKEKFNFILEPINGKYEFYEIPVSEGDYYKKELRH